MTKHNTMTSADGTLPLDTFEMISPSAIISRIIANASHCDMISHSQAQLEYLLESILINTLTQCCHHVKKINKFLKDFLCGKVAKNNGEPLDGVPHSPSKPPLCKGRWQKLWIFDGGVDSEMFKITLNIKKNLNFHPDTIPQSASLTAPFTQGSQ